MPHKVKHRTRQEKRKRAVRKKLYGTADRPRLSVFRSNRYIYLQLVDDEVGETILALSDIAHDENYQGSKTERAAAVAKDLAQLMKKNNIKQVVFDRGPYKYHGRVKAAAEALRKEGINL